MERVRFEWGTQEFCDRLLQVVCPTLFDRGEEARLWFANEMRVGLSPEFAHALNRAFGETDLRPVLPAVKTPTLVLYREGSVELEKHREVAARIEGAHEVRLPGSDYWGIFLSLEIVDEIERFVGDRPVPPVPDSVLATVLFTDIVDSTGRAATLGDSRWRELLSEHNRAAASEIEAERGRLVKSTGDGVLASFDGPARAISAAQALQQRLAPLGLEIRAGVHTGECERLGDDLGGIAVHIGARVSAEADPGEVLVSQTVRDLVVGSGLEFEDRGPHELKGVPGEWRLFAVSDGNGRAQ
jgi:class 3 adenylate cyclase